MPESNNALTEAVYYILLAMLTPLHGYGVMQKVAAMSGGRVNLGTGTLYGAIDTMLKKGWIQEVDTMEKARGKRAYQATDAGREALRLELSRLRELVQSGENALKGGMAP